MTNKVVNGRVVDDKKSCQKESSSKKRDKKGDAAMPLYNQLKEYRSKLGINQTDHQPDRAGRLFTVGDTGIKTCKNL